MSLDKQDLKEIKTIIGGAIEKSEAKMSDKIFGAIEKSEAKMSDKIEFFIEKSEIKMENKIDSVIKESEERINENIKREISDLADINRAAIIRTDQLDYRLRIVERKLGIKT